jgi:hypothetical protein
LSGNRGQRDPRTRPHRAKPQLPFGEKAGNGTAGAEASSKEVDAGVVVVIGSTIIATFALRTVSTLFREESGR